MLKNDLFRQIAVAVIFVVTLVINGMASSGALGGIPTGDVSNAYPVYFVPANLTFSVWAVIYTGLAAFTIYQALPAQRTNPYARRIGWLFAATGILNAIWLVLFQNLVFLATVPVMVVLLLTLIAIYQRIDIGKQVSNATRWLIQVPFSFYLAWITVATIANVTQTLYASDFETLFGIEGPVWAAIMLVVGTVVISLVVYRGRGNAAYALVALWAFLGIVIKQSETPLVSGTAIAMMVVIAAVLGFSLWQNRRTSGQTRLDTARAS